LLSKLPFRRWFVDTLSNAVIHSAQLTPFDEITKLKETNEKMKPNPIFEGGH